MVCSGRQTTKPHRRQGVCRAPQTGKQHPAAKGGHLIKYRPHPFSHNFVKGCGLFFCSLYDLYGQAEAPPAKAFVEDDALDVPFFDYNIPREKAEVSNFDCFFGTGMVSYPCDTKFIVLPERVCVFTLVKTQARISHTLLGDGELCVAAMGLCVFRA